MSILLDVLDATLAALYQDGIESGVKRIVQRRKLNKLRDPRRLLDEVDREFVPLRGTEFARISDAEWERMSDAVGESLRRVKIVELARSSPGDLLSPKRFAELALSANEDRLASYDFGQRSLDAYRMLLVRYCEKIAWHAGTVDLFRRGLDTDTNDKVTSILKEIEESRVDPKTFAATRFERRYVDYVAGANSTFELFEVTVGRAPIGHPFDEFYVVPAITRRHQSAGGSELTGAGTEAANAIAESRRVLLLGGAGSGKTTLLTWLTYNAARAVRDDHEGPWHDVVPFFVSLRQFSDTDLPQPEQLSTVNARPLEGEKPHGWVSDLFSSGRAMLLVDGVDELVPERRAKVKTWLTEIVRAYPGARYVVSTRPSAVAEDWLGGSLGFVEFELLALSRNGLFDLVGKWYAAAVKEESDQRQKDWLLDCQRRLIDQLRSRPKLRSLVSSPLLCALLCALYLRNNLYLPESHKDLLDAALDLLLERWEKLREIPVEDDLRMPKKQKVILLERFAASLVRESAMLVSREVAEQRFERAMQGLRSPGADPARVLEHMLVRTGLLREHTADGKIQFVHRTFRDYLAAGEIVKAGELNTLVAHAHEDSWWEVLFVAAAQARAKEAGTLLRGLLDRAARTRRDRETQERLVLLAAAALGYVDVIDPDQVRIDVANTVRQLIPPASMHDAEMLARAGSFVIDLMPGPEQLPVGDLREEVAARVIRTLTTIGGEEALEKTRPFTTMHASIVLDELLRAWRQTDDSEEYARSVLANVEFGDQPFPVHRWERLLQLRHLTKLTAVNLVGDLQLADPDRNQYPLADLPKLRSLELTTNELVADLAPLTRCGSLRRLRITSFSVLRDLSALAETGIEDLDLHAVSRIPDMDRADLGTLRGARLRRLSVRHPILTDGLHSLPADLPLVELELVGRAEWRNLAGIQRWPGLRKLTINGVPNHDEVRLLGELPRLDHLVINEPRPNAAGLVRLRTLAHLREVDLRGVDERGVTYSDLLPGVEVRVHHRSPAGFP